ncbi:zinc finger domain-containing protein [Amycolatopsis sp. CB00013]|uniref:zinc finger domain-containing protein n=1 Tax=Amycolatopsis sp. CB00013 TaxID=1703945 RepID=UPI00093C8709|nr:hypothetical protein [Amycolatopsis sp. CB00013]
MNRTEVAALLGAASAVDPKVPQPDPDLLTMWAGILDDVPADVAGAAVREHYRHNGETVMPADIVEYWRTVRRDAAEREHAAQLRARAAERPLDLRAIRDGVARVTAALAITRGVDPEYAEAEVEARRAYLAVACTWCKAQPGAPCTGPGGKPLTKQPAHDARLADALTSTR